MRLKMFFRSIVCSFFYGIVGAIFAGIPAAALIEYLHGSQSTIRQFLFDDSLYDLFAYSMYVGLLGGVIVYPFRNLIKLSCPCTRPDGTPWVAKRRTLKTLLLIVSALLLVMVGWGFTELSLGQRAEIVAQDHYANIFGAEKRIKGQYYVIRPLTSAPLDLRSRYVMNQLRAYAAAGMKKATGRDLGFQIGWLLEMSRRTMPIRVDSNPAQGYLVDSKQEFEKYYEPGGGGWPALHRDHPEVMGRTEISVPLFDESTGILLVYKGTRRQERESSGWIIAYQYQGPKLVELGRVKVWTV